MLGIQDLTPDDLKAARARGQAIKLIAAALRQPGGGYRLSVHPAALPLDHPLATTSGWEMGIVWYTDLMGVQFAKVDERGPTPTAAAMLRETTAVWVAVVDSEDRAMSRPAVSVMSRRPPSWR